MRRSVDFTGFAGDWRARWRGRRDTVWGWGDGLWAVRGAALGISQMLDRGGGIGYRRLVGHDHPVAFRLLQNDEVYAHIISASIGGLVAGNDIGEVARAPSYKYLDRVDVVSRIDPALHVGLNVRPAVDDDADEVLGQVIGILCVEGRHPRGLTCVICGFPSFGNVTYGRSSVGTEHCVAEGKEKEACPPVWL